MLVTFLFEPGCLQAATYTPHLELCSTRAVHLESSLD